MKGIFLMLLATSLLLFACAKKEEVTPSLSAGERFALQKKVKAEQAKARARLQRQGEKVFLGSEGSNIACPRLTFPKVAETSFALRCRGGIRGYQKKKLFPSASSSKALLLLAFLRQGADISSYRATLESMIKYSDNAAADVIYNLLGDAALVRVARDIGLRDTIFAGYWASILFSAADLARLFASFPRSFPRDERVFAMNLLENISADQSWGIPAVFAKARVYFKGGWRPEGAGYLLLQGALVRFHDKRFSLAIMTNGFSDQTEAIGVLENIAKRIQESLRER